MSSAVSAGLIFFESEESIFRITAYDSYYKNNYTKTLPYINETFYLCSTKNRNGPYLKPLTP